MSLNDQPTEVYMIILCYTSYLVLFGRNEPLTLTHSAQITIIMKKYD